MRRRHRVGTLLLCLVSIGAGACASRGSRTGPATPAAHARPGWVEEGVASWYGGDDGFEGKPTASGEIYDSSLLTAAHRELPLGTVVDVRGLDNHKTVRVRINDRGPFIQGRIIDLSRAAADRLGLIGPGTGRVRLTLFQSVPDAPLVSPSGLWSVQIGSFADASNAQRHADRARSTGRTISLEPHNGLTRVKVGAYASRGEARDALAALERQGFEGIVVPVD